MKAAKIKFAVVGYGHIGRKHAAMIQGNEHAELVAVVDTDPDKLSEFKTGKIKGFTSYDEFLATDLDIHVINICTPTGCTLPRPFRPWNASRMWSLKNRWD